MAPEAPQVGLRPLLLRGRRHRDVGIAARIQRGGDPPDGAALAGGVVALARRHHGKGLEARIARGHGKAALPLLQFLFVILLRQRPVEFERAQYVEIVGRRGQRRRAVGQPLDGFLIQPLAQRAVAPVGTRHHDPGRLGGRGLAQERVADLDEFPVQLGVFPFEIGDVPARPGVAFQRFQALLLLPLRQMEPVLEQQHALVGEHLFQALDLADVTRELAVADFAQHPVQDRIGVPAAEENADPAFRRQRAPEAPLRRALALLVGRLCEGAGDDVARIHPLVQQVDRFALARALDAGDDDQDGETAVLLEIELRLEQRVAQLRRFAAVGRLVDLVPEIRRLEHACYFFFIRKVNSPSASLCDSS